MVRRRLQMCRALIGGLAVVLLSVPTAAATTYCPIKKTSDGFVALRAGPSTTAKVIARMTDKDEVLVDSIRKAPKGWSFVTWWKGGRFKGQNRNGEDPHNGRGWVRSNLLEEECG